MSKQLLPNLKMEETMMALKLVIVYLLTASLKPDPKNPRSHSEGQIRMLAKSIAAFGFIIPIVVDAAGVIIAGHARWLAAKLLGLKEVPTIEAGHLTAAQRRAFTIADKVDQFQHFDLNAPPDFERVVQSWDTAYKPTQLSDFSVCTVWGIVDKKIYLLDVVRDRFPYPDLCARAAALARTKYNSRMPDTILIENKASGQSLLQSLHRDGIYSLRSVTPDTDKLTRMSSQTNLIANGAVYIPREAPWLGNFLQELMAFPRGRHDDQVDSVSQALNWFADSNDEPGILAHYRKRWEEMYANPDDDVIVTMRRVNPNVNVLQPAKDNPIFIGADGLFRIPMRHARNLHPPEWIRVEES